MTTNVSAIKVPLLDLSQQYKSLQTELESAVLEVMRSTTYIMGPKIEELERAIATYCECKHGIAVSSGTDALLVALMALDLAPGDLVITSPFSFFATAGVIARLNAIPVLCEIDPKTFNLSPETVKRWLIENPDKVKKVKAIMPVHLFGQCADMDGFVELSQQYNIPIIEDAAQAIGSLYPSKKSGLKKAGSIGLIGCFSFFPSKNLGGIGDGGIVTVQDDALAEKIRILRTHGSKPKYYHSMIGGNFRLDPLQAAALIVKLKHLDTWHQKRRENAAFYDGALAELSAVTRPFLAYDRSCHIYNQYVLMVGPKRDQLRAFLSEHGVGTEVYYPVPFHEQKCFTYLGYKTGDFPESEKAAKESVAIPIYPELTRPMQEHVVSCLQQFFGVR